MGSEGRPHVVVVGAGIAGLAAAHALGTDAGAPLRVTVLEAASHVGGKLRVQEVAGLAVDTGAEALLARRPEAVELARAVGLAADLVDPETTKAAVWSRGALRPLPSGTVLGVPADRSALAASGLLTDAELARAATEPDDPLPTDGDVGIGRLVADRLGPAVRDRLVEPLLGGVYAGRADQLSLTATAPALAGALRDHRTLGAAAAAVAAAPTAPGPVFAGITGGVGRLSAAVAASLVAAGAAVRTGATVRALGRLPDGRWRLVVGPTTHPEPVEADAVVLAVPATPAARLLAEVAPEAAATLGGIPYASVAVVTLALRTADLPQLSGSGFLVPPVEGRLVKGTTFSSRKWAWVAAQDPATTLVRGSVGRIGEERDLHRDDADLARAVGADLAAALGVGDLRPVASRVTRWGGALPQYEVGHRDRVAAVEHALAGLRGLALAGAAYDGIGVAACVASGQRAATRVRAGLVSSGTMVR